jgi:hypothetical protein
MSRSRPQASKYGRRFSTVCKVAEIELMTNKSGRDSVVGARRGGSLMAKDRR